MDEVILLCARGIRPRGSSMYAAVQLYMCYDTQQVQAVQCDHPNQTQAALVMSTCCGRCVLTSYAQT